MPWDANIVSTQFKGKLPLQSFNNLRGALAERCTASGTAIPAILNADLTKMNKIPDAWCSTFQSTITTLIAAYVNHTDNGGDWTGQIFPKWEDVAGVTSWVNQTDNPIVSWTEASILTAIGDVSRLPAPSSLKAAAWCYQQYKILNLLRWVKKFRIQDAGFTVDSVSEFRFGSGATYAAALSDYNSRSWTATSPTFIYSTYTKSPLYIRNQRSQYSLFPFSPGFQASIDFYMYFSRYSTITEYYSADGYIENSIVKMFSVSEMDISSGYTTPTIELGIAADSSADVSGCNQHIIEYSGTTYPCLMFILKFDGANGFSFKDW